MPFKYCLFFRFSLFSHKILDRYFLLNISDLLETYCKNVNTRAKKNNIFVTTLVTSKSGVKRISILLSIMVNKVLRNSTNLSTNLTEYILTNLHLLFLKFSEAILKKVQNIFLLILSLIFTLFSSLFLFLVLLFLLCFSGFSFLAFSSIK